MRLALSLFLLFFLQVGLAQAQSTIQVCNNYSFLPGKACTGAGDCPDGDPLDAGAGACISETGTEVDICNAWSFGAGTGCAGNDANCLDITAGDLGQGTCGVLTHVTPALSYKIPYRYHPQYGATGFPVLVGEALRGLFARIPLFDVDDCRANVLTAQIGQSCSQAEDGVGYLCTNPAAGGASALYCDAAVDWTLSTGAAQGLQPQYNAGNDVVVGSGGSEWSGMDSPARAFVKCNTGCTRGKREYDDVTNGWTEENFPPDNKITNIPSTFAQITQGAGTELERFTAAGAHSYSNAGRPQKSIVVSASRLTMQGACVLTTAAVVSGGETETYIVCTGADTDGFNDSFLMPDAWDGGTITVEMASINVNATPSGNFEVDFSARCVRGNIDDDAAITTTGEQPATVTFSNNNLESHVTTAAITPNGTCAAGSRLKFQGQIDNTASTTTQNSDIKIRDLKIEYTVTSRDDN